MKRAFLIAGIALVVLTVAFLTFYFLVYRPAVPQNAVDIAVPDEDDVELTSDDRDAGVTREEKHEEIRREQNVNADNAVTITKIIDREVMNPTLSGNGERILFFDPAEKEFLSTDLFGGDEDALTSASFEDVESVTWSSMGP